MAGLPDIHATSLLDRLVWFVNLRRARIASGKPVVESERGQVGEVPIWRGGRSDLLAHAPDSKNAQAEQGRR